MRRLPPLWTACAIVVAAFGSGCATTGKKLATEPARPVLGPVADVPTTPPASLAWAVHRAERHLVQGIAAYEAKRPDEAREEFAESLRAFDAPGIDVQADPSARAAYQRFLERVSTYDVDALAAVTREETPLELLGNIEFLLKRPNPKAEEEIRAAVGSLSFDVPVQVNDEVLAYVDYFRTRHRVSIQAGLHRGGRYIPMMREVFRQEGLPQDLVYMALIESNFKPQALSRAKAKGVWQFIAETGRRYGLRQSSWLDERSDPEKATRAAAGYLKDLYGMFGDWYLAMAAYNCGEMKIVRELQNTTATGYWDLVRMNRLREETKNYVPAILAGMIVAKNPEAFGFETDFEPPLRYESVVLPVSTDLRTVARKLETSVDYLRELNPELRKGRTPPTPYTLKVPPGRGGSLVQDIFAMAPEERGGSTAYTVRKGDTLFAIARAHRVPMDELAEWNDISPRTKLRPGAVLQVPVRPGQAPERGPSSSVATMAESGRVEPVAPREASDAEPARGRKVTYRVKKGDTLYRISQRYRVSASQIAKWNEGVGRDLQPGDVLTIYLDDARRR